MVSLSNHAFSASSAVKRDPKPFTRSTEGTGTTKRANLR
jgi:hypothetical protein